MSSLSKVMDYMNSDTKVAACFLDSSKAFDRVKQDKLFLTLIKRDIAPLDIRLLYRQYKYQSICADGMVVALYTFKQQMA
jgi:hypothetical protein